MISGAIVIATVALGGAFVVAWLCSSELRRRVEQPKYRFLARLEQYHRARVEDDGRTVR